ncbi:hypothetical protein OG701_38505 [Streptomyces uncialis]|nr:hypothetical protein [Streptomyces uncialis]
MSDTDKDPHVYGTYPDDPDKGRKSGHEYVTLSGGPLDGFLLDVTGMAPEEREEGVALISDNGRYEGGRSLYGPKETPVEWEWEGDIP